MVPQREKAFTLIELLVVVAIIALLISMLLPSLNQARDLARATACLANQKQIGIALMGYVNEYGGTYPIGVKIVPTSWPPTVPGRPHPQLLLPYTNRSFDLWVCPTDPTPGNYIWWWFHDKPDFNNAAGTNRMSYMFNERILSGPRNLRTIVTTSRMRQPARVGYMTDGCIYPNGWSWYTLDYDNPLRGIDIWHYRIDWTHLDSVNVLFGDMHAATENQSGISTRVLSEPINN